MANSTSYSFSPSLDDIITDAFERCGNFSDAQASINPNGYGKKRISSGLVYVAVNTINQKKYFGITSYPIKDRERSHRSVAKSGVNTIFAKSLRKHGADIEFSKIYECSSYDEARFIEICLIGLFNPEYNSTKGGEGVYGFRPSKETIEKVRIAKAKNPVRYWLGKKRDPETAKKRLETLKNKPRRMPTLAESCARSKSILAAIESHKKPVICISDNKIFPSASDAAKYYKLSKTSIKLYCLKERRNRHGLVFEWEKSYGK